MDTSYTGDWPFPGSRNTCACSHALTKKVKECSVLAKLKVRVCDFASGGEWTSSISAIEKTKT